jgi:ERCC4-related helicase
MNPSRTNVGRVTVLMAKGSVDKAYYYNSRHEEERARHLVENVKQKRPRHRKRRTTVSTASNHTKTDSFSNSQSMAASLQG